MDTEKRVPERKEGFGLLLVRYLLTSLNVHIHVFSLCFGDYLSSSPAEQYGYCKMLVELHASPCSSENVLISEVRTSLGIAWDTYSKALRNRRRKCKFLSFVVLYMYMPIIARQYAIHPREKIRPLTPI